MPGCGAGHATVPGELMCVKDHIASAVKGSYEGPTYCASTDVATAAFEWGSFLYEEVIVLVQTPVSCRFQE